MSKYPLVDCKCTCCEEAGELMIEQPLAIPTEACQCDHLDEGNRCECDFCETALALLKPN